LHFEFIIYEICQEENWQFSDEIQAFLNMIRAT